MRRASAFPTSLFFSNGHWVTPIFEYLTLQEFTVCIRSGSFFKKRRRSRFCGLRQTSEHFVLGFRTFLESKKPFVVAVWIEPIYKTRFVFVNAKMIFAYVNNDRVRVQPSAISEIWKIAGFI